MRRYYRHFGPGFGFPHFGFRFWGPWGGRAWGFGFPRRRQYLAMLEEYREDLEEMQQEIAEELEAVTREIEELKREGSGE